MGKALDISGQKFNRLTAIEKTNERYNSYIVWVFHCDCGNIVKKPAKQVKIGNTKSCGCLDRDVVIARNQRLATHRMTGTRTFKSWESARQRCSNPHNKDFHNYGGRGISVCDRWKNSFENFFSDMGERPKGKTLDRIDSNGNYEPSNCKWSTPKEQNDNRRINYDPS